MTTRRRAYPQVGAFYTLHHRLDKDDERRGNKWKVTGVFTLRTTDQIVPCVRLRPLHGPSESFTRAEFWRVFKELHGAKKNE